MDLLVALTCRCLILFKIMLFVCAWVHVSLLYTARVCYWNILWTHQLMAVKSFSAVPTNVIKNLNQFFHWVDLQFCLEVQLIHHQILHHSLIYQSSSSSSCSVCSICCRHYLHAHEGCYLASSCCFLPPAWNDGGQYSFTYVILLLFRFSWFSFMLHVPSTIALIFAMCKVTDWVLLHFSMLRPYLPELCTSAILPGHQWLTVTDAV